MALARRSLGLAALLVVALGPSSALAKDFFVDPQAGSMGGDGSEQKPWKTLEEVIAANLIETQNWSKLPYADGAQLAPKNAGAPVKAGDTIWLRSGYHGEAKLVGYYNAEAITIAAAPGEKPTLARLEVTSGQNWLFKGLYLGPSYAPAYDASKPIVALDDNGYSGPAHDFTLEGCFLESVPDTSSWTGDQWLTLPADGIRAGGSHHVLRGNRLHNVRFGISVDATDTLVEKNVVDSFGNGDGMRGLGDNSVFQYNLVKNGHHPDPDASKGNHDDGFQSWSLGTDPADGKTKPGFGVVKGIVLRGNVLINDENPNEPFASKMQGIGCFDGMYEGFVIENNVIVSDTYHGIALYGAKDCRIVNNTVIYRTAGTKTVPWIMIHDHKDGTPSTGNVVRNNLVSAMMIQSAGVTQDHNLVFDDPTKVFVDAMGLDLHLVPGSPAVDQGSPDLAPPADADGTPRPQGSAVDLGAYEWQGGMGGAAGSGGTGGSGAGGSGNAGAGGSGAAGKAGSGQAGGGGSGVSGAGGSTAGQGGSAGKGGMTGSSGNQGGGSSGAPGAAAGGAGGSGGKQAGGSSGSGPGTQGGQGGAPQGAQPDESSGDDGGCGCRAAGSRPAAASALALALVGLGLRRRRR